MLCSCIGEYFLANLRSGRFFSFAQLPRRRSTHGAHVALAFKGAFKQGLSGETARRIRSGILEFPELTCQSEVGNPPVNGSECDTILPRSTSHLLGVVNGGSLAASSKSSGFRLAWVSFHHEPSLICRNILLNTEVSWIWPGNLVYVNTSSALLWPIPLWIFSWLWY